MTECEVVLTKIVEQQATQQTVKQTPQQKTTTNNVASNSCNGHKYVDLGLPSGILWATCNVGASTPEEYGGYYAWGETETKSSYTKGNSKTCDKNMSDISGNPAYDVARAKWGSNWRMPTKAEFEELLNNCTCKYTTLNGKDGFKITSKKNGNSIFLPAAGNNNDGKLYNAGIYSSYWSSSLDTSDLYRAWRVCFSSRDVSRFYDPRYFGLPIRPVCP